MIQIFLQGGGTRWSFAATGSSVATVAPLASERIYAAAIDVVARGGLRPSTLTSWPPGFTARVPRSTVMPAASRKSATQFFFVPPPGSSRPCALAVGFERCRADRHCNHGGAQRDSNRSTRSAGGHVDSRSRRWHGSPTLRSWPGSPPISMDSPTTIRRPRNGSSASCCPCMYWPIDDADAEREAVQRFVSPAFGPRTVGFDRT